MPPGCFTFCPPMAGWLAGLFRSRPLHCCCCCSKYNAILIICEISTVLSLNSKVKETFLVQSTRCLVSPDTRQHNSSLLIQPVLVVLHRGYAEREETPPSLPAATRRITRTSRSNQMILIPSKITGLAKVALWTVSHGHYYYVAHVANLCWNICSALEVSFDYLTPRLTLSE